MEVHRANGTRFLELDTVRALHQTVVSLRAALEASQTELHNLRQKYETHSDTYTDTTDNPTRESASLRKKLVPEGPKELQEDTKVESIQHEDSSKKVQFCFDSKENEPPPLKDGTDRNGVNVEHPDTDVSNVRPSPGVISEEYYFKENIEKVVESDGVTRETLTTHEEHTTYYDRDKQQNIPEIHVDDIIVDNVEDTLSIDNGEYETKVELESKFDVTIKVSSNKAGEFNSVITSVDSNTVNVSCQNLDKNLSKSRENVSDTFSNSIVDIKSTEEIILNRDKPIIETLKMAGSREADRREVNRNPDKLNVQVKITSQENLLIEPSPDRGSNPDHFNLEPDEISVRSISEGDNSVFSERMADGSKREQMCEQESVSGNESEEVDDIELIFTTDDTKELTGFQEDLVSITEGDSWPEGRNEASTPVLLKFSILDPDNQSRYSSNVERYENDQHNKRNTSRSKDVNSRKGILRKKHPNDTMTQSLNDSDPRKPLLRSSSSKNYLDATEANTQFRKNYESNESFSFDNQKSFSFDNTKSSSFERGSSVETRDLSFDHRDESVDQFDVLKTTLKTKYSVCVETDISKCGMMEDDSFSGNIVRRNTCPNPFQYRPLAHRDVVRGQARPQADPAGPPVPRRSSSAQTHISALPAHWSSDTHLSKKMLPLALTTLPGHLLPPPARPPRAPLPSHPHHRTQETRRLLLSDIGFTSMVPELSRSAEPVWGGAEGPLCCAQHACLASPSSPPSTPSSPCKHDRGTSRYWSKNSMQRSFSGRVGDCQHRVTFSDQPLRWRGSLPELRGRCCSRTRAEDSEDSTEELLGEADRFLACSIGSLITTTTPQDELWPSRSSRPYLPSGPRHLRLGHLAKVITPQGRIALGKVKYVGIAGGPWSGSAGAGPPTLVGLQMGRGALGSAGGDGSFRGRRYFHCEPGRSLFVPFSKVVMAWADC